MELRRSHVNVFTCFTGQKFGFDATNASITDQEGSEIDSIEVIRDNDKLFIVEGPNCL